MSTKDDYLRRIKIKKKNIEDWRDLYGQDSFKYKARKQRNLKEIARLEARISMLEKRSVDVKKLDKMVRDFLDVPVKTKRSELPKEAKQLLYKWGLENGMRAYDLQEYTGVHKYSGYAAVIRKRFTKSFTDHPNSRGMWDRFKIFMTSPNH